MKLFHTDTDYSTLILGVFTLHKIAHSGCLKLFGREMISKVFQPMWSWYLNVMDRQTDRQTDRRTD